LKIKFRNGLRVIVWIIAIFIGMWLIVWGYVIINKKSLLSKVNAELTTKVRGEISIGDIEPSLLSTFPNISIRLSQVVVRDSLWKFHHHDLFNADRVFIRFRLLSLFTGSPDISKVIIDNGAIFIFSDTAGYSNEYLFQSKKTTENNKSTSKLSIPDIEMKKVLLTVDLKDRKKLYDFNISQLNCYIRQIENSLSLNVKTDLVVKSLAFNTERGSFIKEKPVRGKFNLKVDLTRKKLAFNNIELKIDDHPFSITGMFDFTSVPLLYYFDIKTSNILFKNATSLVTDKIRLRLDSFTVENSIDISAVIDGRSLPNNTPVVDIDVKFKNNNVTIPIGRFDDASFTGHFNNKVVKSEGCSDDNSGLYFTGCTAKWENLAVRSDSVKIINLKHPVMDCDIHAAFELSALNELLGTNNIAFVSGSCNADARYHGIVMKADTASVGIFGNINLQQASIRYVPRNLLFTDCSGSLVFDDKDFFVKQLKTHIGNSNLIMNGAVKNLTSLIDKSPEKLTLKWSITSPKIVLSDFMSFLNKRSTAAPKKASAKKIVKLANQVDKLLNDCSVELQVNADRLIYKKFNADKVAANLQLTDKMVILKNVLVEHAGGTLALNGSLTEDINQNQIKINSNMVNVDVTKVFTAFDNFGQDGIIDKNLKGRLTANIAITGSINSKAEIDQDNLKGEIDLHLKDGALINFDPVKKISQTAFKNRDFSDIHFADLTDKLEINGTKIKVNRMEIQSTVLTMFVEGTYDVRKGSDFGIQIPLSNLAKRGADFEPRNKGVNSKTGMSINLRARTGEDGKVKVSWDPFKNALKKKNKLIRKDNFSADSTEIKK